MLAPSGFKESLSAEEVVAAMALGIRRAMPAARILRAPIPDGGEGFARTLHALRGGGLHEVRVSGPLGRKVNAEYAVLKDRRTAAIEIAQAAGLRLVPETARDPRRTTSYGVGQMIASALDQRVRRIIIGCGDSGVNDAGAGFAQALGARLLDRRGKQIARGGAALRNLARIDLSKLDPRVRNTRIDVAVNWKNILLGPRGVARVFGPQKGASPKVVAELEDAMENFARVVKRDQGIRLATLPGAGASGGLGAGFHALLGAKLHPRFDIISEFLDLDALIAKSDLVLTAEGRLDAKTSRGKVPVEMARRAVRFGVPVIAIAGAVGEGARDTLRAGLQAYISVLKQPSTLDQAISEAPELIAEAAEQALRMVMAGRRH